MSDNAVQEKESDRVSVYDWVRLIATILVVIAHSAYLRITTVYGGVAYVLPESISPVYYSALLTWCRELAAWGFGCLMPLFFMLSGAVLALKPIAPFDQVFRAKVKRLIIPYYVYGWFFMLPVKRLGNFYTNASLLYALKGFLFGDDSGHLWFLTALFWCIIVFVICKKMLDVMGIRSVYAILLLGGLIQLTASDVIPFDILGLKRGLENLFYFALGYVFECERSSNEKWNIRKTVLAFIILLLLEILDDDYNLLNSFFVIVIGSFMIYLLADLLNRLFSTVHEKRGWKLLINNLFYIYLFHDPLEYIVLRLFFGFNWLSSALGCYAYVFCRTAVVFVTALLLSLATGKMKYCFGRLLGDKLKMQLEIQ